MGKEKRRLVGRRFCLCTRSHKDTCRRGRVGGSPFTRLHFCSCDWCYLLLVAFFTRTLQVAYALFVRAVIMAIPFLRALTMPDAFTVAIFGLLLSQVTGIPPGVEADKARDSPDFKVSSYDDSRMISRFLVVIAGPDAAAIAMSLQSFAREEDRSRAESA